MSALHIRVGSVRSAHDVLVALQVVSLHVDMDSPMDYSGYGGIRATQTCERIQRHCDVINLTKSAGKRSRDYNNVNLFRRGKHENIRAVQPGKD